MTSTALDAALDDVLDHLDDELPPAHESFIATLQANALFIDRSYQRPLDELRVARMADEFDISLIGVIEVSDRGDGTYAIIDGQHRWALLREVNGNAAYLACNVHRGLSPAQEAALFFTIDATRRRLTGWDRWWSRRGAGDPAVLAIEACVAERGLKVDAPTKDGVVRATRACEVIVDLGGTELLGQALDIVRASYGDSADGLDGDIIGGVANVLHAYSGELDNDRLIKGLQSIAPRQLKARAVALREAHKGVLPRLVAAVIIDRYNAAGRGNIEDFLVRVKPQSKSKIRGREARQREAMRRWGINRGLMAPSDRLTKAVREAYLAAHGDDA
jgi:hypothetical protein